MTNEEAIRLLKEDKAFYESDICYAGDGTPDGEFLESLDMAIAAIEKQIPKQVGVDGYGWYECSECHNKRPNWLLHKDAKWCPYCGQRIDWREGEENDNT